jgi:hypothetical protein
MTPNPTIEQMRIDVLRWMGVHFYTPSDAGFPWSVCECGTPPTEHLGPPPLTLDWLHDIIRGFTPDEFRIFLGFLANVVYPKRDVKTIPHMMSMDEFQGCWNATEEQVLTAVYQTKKGSKPHEPTQ